MPIPPVPVVAPPTPRERDHAHVRWRSGEGRQLAEVYAAVAREKGCPFFDAGTVARVSEVDGVHLDAHAHAALAEVLASVVSERLGGSAKR